MKKILLSIVTLTLAIAVLVPTAAYASTKQETEICNFVTKQEKVTDAKCVIGENICIIAIKTEKFVNKTEYDQFKENLKQQLEDKYDFDHIIVTRSPKAMHAISEISKLSDAEREQAIKDFIDTLLSQRPQKLPIQPRG